MVLQLTYWTRHSDSATMAHTAKTHFIVTVLLSTVEDNVSQWCRTANQTHVTEVIQYNDITEILHLCRSILTCRLPNVSAYREACILLYWWTDIFPLHNDKVRQTHTHTRHNK